MELKITFGFAMQNITLKLFVLNKMNLFLTTVFLFHLTFIKKWLFMLFKNHNLHFISYYTIL